MQAYLVIRTKRGESQQKRLKTLLQGPVFRLHHGTDSFRQVSHNSLAASLCQSGACMHVTQHSSMLSLSCNQS